MPLSSGERPAAKRPGEAALLADSPCLARPACCAARKRVPVRGCPLPMERRIGTQKPGAVPFPDSRRPQWDISTGKFMRSRMALVTPPKIVSRSREWP
jgi:hypothetical protein